MEDHTLPLSGGWIMITRELPTEIKPPLLSMYYATPDRLFPKGWHTCPPEFSEGAGLSQTDMTLLWRYRRGGRLLPHEKQEIEKFERHGVELDQRVRIITPQGEVWVEPYEWTEIPDISTYMQMVDGEHVKMHMLGGYVVSGNMEEQLFYMMQRGLDKITCYRLLMGEIKKPNVCWLEMHEEYASFFFGDRPRKRTVGEPMRVEIHEGA